MSRDFSGEAGAYLNVGDVAAIDITGTLLTISCWLNPNTLSGFPIIFAKGVAGGGVQYMMYFSGTVPHFVIGDAGGNDDIGGSNASPGSWQHLAGVKNGTGAGSIKLYLNSSEVASGTSARTIQNLSDSLCLGMRSDLTLPYHGRMAEAAIWAAALTADEIASLAKGFDPRLARPRNLRGFWPLMGNVSPEPDLMNGNNATINGTVSKADHPRVYRPAPVLV